LSWIGGIPVLLRANILDVIVIFNNPILVIINLVISYMSLSCNFYPIDIIVDFSQSVWG
jgi:hypothetical protein